MTSAATRPIHRLDPRRALLRFSLAAALGVACELLVSLRFSPVVAVLGGWDVAAVVLLVLSVATVSTTSPARTRTRAASEDPGRTAVYALVILSSLISLVAAVVLSRRASVVAPGETRELVGLCLAAVGLSWALTHLAFTLRYAHLYYREGAEKAGGVDFPGGAAPSYSDFAYFAFTVGMCFQVSDVMVTNARIRRTVLLHALLAFAYNTAILAFVLNLVFSMAG